MTRVEWGLATAVLAVVVAGMGLGCCRSPSGEKVAMREDAGFDVLKNGKRVEWIKDAPGPLIGQAPPPPPGTPMTMHPFLTATSLDIEEEDNLQRLTDKAKDFEDYVALLKKNGYEVVPSRSAP